MSGMLGSRSGMGASVRTILPAVTLVMAVAAVGALFPTLAGAARMAAWAGCVVVVIRSDLTRFIIPDAASAAIATLGLADRITVAWPDGIEPTLQAAGVALAAARLPSGCSG